MASIYTHYIFGQEVLKRLPAQFRNIIERHMNFYILGQQGPDFFYFYKPITTIGSTIGTKIHNSSCEEFLLKNEDILQNPTEEQLAYLYGFLCHFALDIMVHPYVNNLEIELQLSHMEIETELDRYFMIKNQQIPYEVETYKLIPTESELSEQIYPLYSAYRNTNQRMIQNAVKGFSKYKKLLHSPTRKKEKLIYFIMKRLGIYSKYKGQVLTQVPERKASVSNEILAKRYYEAIPVAVHLIDSLFNYQENQGSLSHYFGYNFLGVQLDDI